MVSVDGSRDGPPGKTASNWSRRDNIRAGAVSGPWRSAPRAAGGLDPEAPVAPAAVEPGVVEPAAAVVASGRMAAAAKAAPAEQPTGGRSIGERPRGAQALVAWSAVGGLAAAAIVLAAVLLRPGADETDASGGPEAPVAAATGGEEAPAVVTPGDALAAVTVVRLRVGPSVDAAERDALVGALKSAGVPEVMVEPLTFRIATSRVGYYREGDLAAAEALARLMSPMLGSKDTVGVRDYGKLLTDPQAGRLDLWVGG